LKEAITMKNKVSEYERGVRTAASLAGEYDRCSHHEYRLEDCILGKLNVGSRAKPRRNRYRAEDPADAWVRGFVLALAELHRSLVGGANGSDVRRIANDAGVTIEFAKKAKCLPYDLRELKRAGVEAE
jgi:hypothetical protein